MSEEMTKFDYKNFNSKQNYAIEASAGTGKTHNIIQIVKLLVNEGIEKWKLANPDIKDEVIIKKQKAEILNKILVVTYTEKAAGELKNRIREALDEVDVDNASIFTIHSFCKKVIDEFAISSNLPMNLSMVDDNALNDFIDIKIREGKIFDKIVELITNNISINLETIKAYISGAIKVYYLNKDYKQDKKIIYFDKYKEYEDRLKLIIDIAKANNLTELENNNPEIKKNLQVLRVYAEKDEYIKGFIDALEKNLKNKLNYNGNNFKKKITDVDLKNAMNYFSELKNSLKSASEASILVAALYFDEIYKSYLKEKEINKSQDFDDMIRYVRESVLNEDTLINKLKEKYKYGIIDEFQDTNQKQFDIFSKIFMSDDPNEIDEDKKHHIIIVGDPKQSIYAFQGADVDVYRKAVKEITNDKIENKYYLGKNFRSSTELVEACNDLFKYYRFFDSDAFFTPSEHLVEGDPKTIKRFKYKGEPTKAIWIGSDSNLNPIKPADYARLVVEQIVDFTTKENGHTRLEISDKEIEINGKKVPVYRDVTYKDFTILAKSRSEMGYIESQLKKVGIPALRYKDTRLFTGIENYHFIVLLEALDTIDFTGKNRVKFKKVLFTNFFGLSLKEISKDIYNKDNSPQMEIILKWKRLAANKHYEDLFDSVITDSGIIKNMEALGKMQSLSTYKQIANYCIDYLASGKTITDLIRKLTDMSLGGSDDDNDDKDGSIVEKGTNFDSVQIMTIHASKGLQFPIVISVAGFKEIRPQNSLCSYHQGDIHYLSFEKNELANKESIEEFKRLFYVAYTRAEYMMILPLYGSKKGIEFLNDTLVNFINEKKEHYKLINLNKTPYSSIKKQVTITLKEIEELEEQNNNSNDNFTKEEQDKVLRSLISSLPHRSTYKYSYATLSHGHEVEIDDELLIDEEIEIDREGNKEEGLKEFDNSPNVIQIDGYYDIDPEKNKNYLPLSYPSGTYLGNALHEIFEVIDYTDYDSYLEKVIEVCFIKQGYKMDDSWLAPTVTMVNHVLKAKLPVVHANKATNEYFSLNEISEENKKAEMEFNFNLYDERLKNYFNGFIDLVFKRGEYYSILDWKSDRLNDKFLSYSDKDELKKHIDDLYSIQRVLYSYCLIKWLFLAYQEDEETIFNKHFGGVYYVCLRGCYEGTSNGVYIQTWSSYKDIEEAFNKIVKEKVK